MSALARRSALVLGLLFGLMFAVGIGLMWYLDMPVSYAVAFALGVTLLQYALSPMLIDYIFTIRWSDPQEISPEFADWYFRCSNQIGISAPRFGIISDGNPNAFTYGRTRNDARVVITSGLAQMLTPDELRAVVAHELGHVRNRDFIIMTLAQAVPLVLYVLYVWTRDRARNISYGIIVSIGAYLVYIFSQYVVLSLSRIREFFADRSSAQITSDPNSLAGALIKICYGLSKQLNQFGRQEHKRANAEQEEKAGLRASLASSGVATLGIASARAASGFAISAADAAGSFSETAMANAMQWELENPWAKWFQINSTHPLTVRRVLALNDAAREMGIAPRYGQINDRNRLLHYTGNFWKEVFIYVLPLLAALVSLAVCLSSPGAHSWSEHLGYGLIGFGLGWFTKLLFVYPNLDGTLREVQDLVGNEINASHISPVPCIVEGQIIGRGTPGLFWADDLVLRDRTGFIYLQYRQPLYIFEFLFGWLKAERYVNRPARVYGWYRRAPSPYIEISHVEIIDGPRVSVRCYYRWGAYVFSLALFTVGLFISGVL